MGICQEAQASCIDTENGDLQVSYISNPFEQCAVATNSEHYIVRGVEVFEGSKRFCFEELLGAIVEVAEDFAFYKHLIGGQ